MYSSRYVLLLISVLFIFIMTSCSSNTGTHLILATATIGGTYYPVGVGIAMLTSTTLDSLSMTAITSAGSGENIQLLKNREADLAILQGLYGAMAWQGKGIYNGKPEKDIRSVTMLWQNVEHFVILSKYAKTGNISDLKNLRNMNFSIGRRGSGTEISGRVIALACGFDPEEDFNLQYLGYTSSAQALQDGRISGMNIPAGPPASSISQAAATIGSKNIRILEFTDEQLDAVNVEFPVWTRYIIGTGTYPGQDRDIRTISQSNLLVVHREISERVVYRIVKCIYEKLPILQNIHPATKAMSLQKAITGLSVPLHPGAVRYYNENGIQIPQHLMHEQSN
jgi:TRAP transporter TAXI family solute receptor